MLGILGRASVCFAGGVFGALLAGVAIWMAGRYGWTAALGVAIAPQWEAAWIFPHLIWGGLWGLLFVPGLLGESLFWRGLFLSFGPSLVQLLIVYPSQAEAGLLGLGLGNWTALVVVGGNAVWGWGTALWVMTALGGGASRYRRLH